MEDLFPLRPDGSLDAKATARQFASFEKEIQNSIDDPSKLNAARKRLVDVSLQLTNLAACLPRFDRERYGNKLERLLAAIQERELRNAPAGQKRFHFTRKPPKQQKPQASTPLAAPCAAVTPANALASTYQVVRVGPADTHFADMRNCQLLSEATAPVTTSALHLQRIVASSVKLRPIPFEHGSLYIEDCEDVTFMLECPPESDIQIRLRCLRNCKLCITRPDAVAQKVVLERCTDCIFEKSSQEKVLIQDFGNLGFLDSQPTNYSFASWV
ncbi:FAFL149Cp [Eremothecium gossypii FDAG1]|nr:FAFL149Cp [Eremothecium gossypii FDAG1]